MHGFSDEERERIRKELVEVGREKILAYGLKKTNVEDITEPVGIAKSSFYLFFDSKAELYLEIMRREVDELTESLENELDGIDDPREGFERLCWCYKAFVENNPLVQQLFRDDSYRMFRDNVSPERLAEIEREGVAEVVPYVEFFQERSDGLLAECDPVTVLGVLGTIELLALHREDYEEYDDEYYERVQELLITTLTRGLTVERTE
ncbi:TetR/AcrR family transcriptional regulator [Natronococcus wangiae]|uniref:TetR/AcrR family transcriptional regulator n=1 Tax=Natronococcus wangiae TaxID=3068275 RepID=UPI002740120B|nr:TetR/AcrR family transcriptional regulator [Natronococcus sp. AD5]